MARRRIEGYWTCDYCGTKGIGGLTKTCPNCGHPQSKGLKFDVNGGPKRYLDSETAKDYGKGADWVCAYCGSYNRYSDVTCRNCGAGKADADGDYFGREVKVTPKEDYNSEHYMSEEEQKAETEQQAEEKEVKQMQSPWNEEEASDNFHRQSSKWDYDKLDEEKSNGVKSFFSSINWKTALGIFGGAVAVVAVIMLLVSIFTPKEYAAQVVDKSWNRSVTIQELRTLDESDWDVPYGGRVYDERQEIRDYDHVIDHYETVEKKVSREEFDYYDYEYYDNGDGTFDEEKIPVYKTVYDTEYEDVPVYKDVPIYDTKYYYEIDRWCYDRTETSSGKSTDKPYWPEFELGYKEREAGKAEKYTVYFGTKEKTYSKNFSYSEWKEYDIGQKCKITVVAGVVTEVETSE